MPASVPSSATMSVSARAGARPSGRMPTRRRGAPCLQLVADHRRARKVPGFAAALADHPGEAGFDRRGQFVDVVAVQAKPGLQPQRIARAQAGGRHFRLRQQRVGQRLGAVGGHAKSRTRPRRCSRSARPGRECRAMSIAADAHEGQRRRLRRQPRQHRRRRRALQRQQRAVLDASRSCTPAGRLAAIWVKSIVLAAGVHDQEQPVAAEIGDHQVVEDAAGLVGEQRVALPAGLQPERCRRAPAVPARRRRWRRSASPGPCGRRRTAPPATGSAGAPPSRRRGSARPVAVEVVLHRHGVAGEPHHAGAQRGGARHPAGWSCSGLGVGSSGRAFSITVHSADRSSGRR